MNDLIHKIVGTIIEVGQSDVKKFRLGETIRYTPSEILEILKQHENEIFGEKSSTQTNAFNALNALDTISRQAAIDALIKCGDYYNGNDEAKRGVSQCIEVVYGLPSAQPDTPMRGSMTAETAKNSTDKTTDEPKLTWTPTNKRLPDKEATYLITTSKGCVYLWTYKSDMENIWKRFVAAWCNLPEPYKE